MGASASPTDRTGWAVIAPKVQPSRQRKTRRKTLWKRRTVEKSEERLFPRAWKSRQVRGIPTFPQRPRRLDDEESQKPKPDISLATKSGHFNLLRTPPTGAPGLVVFETRVGATDECEKVVASMGEHAISVTRERSPGSRTARDPGHPRHLGVRPVNAQTSHGFGAKSIHSWV